ncbi:hypothetical protein Peur_042353 [Populus x canadensis]
MPNGAAKKRTSLQRRFLRSGEVETKKVLCFCVKIPMMYGFGFMMQLETPLSSLDALSWTWFCSSAKRSCRIPPTLPWGLAAVVSSYQLAWFFFGHPLAQWMDYFRDMQEKL